LIHPKFTIPDSLSLPEYPGFLSFKLTFTQSPVAVHPFEPFQLIQFFGKIVMAVIQHHPGNREQNNQDNQYQKDFKYSECPADYHSGKTFALFFRKYNRIRA
jgi:hypothetical protein